jgi:hypothetical protein
MQWASLNDSRLLRRASEEFDVLLTVDQSIEFQHVLPPNLALITLVSRSIEIHALRTFIPDILRTLESIRAGDKVRIGSGAPN